MKKIQIVLLFAVFAVNSNAQITKYTLQQCIDTALKNNIQVRRAGLIVQTASVNQQQAKMNLLPNLNGRLDYGFNAGRNVDPITNTFTNNQLSSSNAGLGSTVVLFNGLRLQNLIKQTTYNYRSAELDHQQEQENLALNVLLAFMQVLSNEDILAVSKIQLQVSVKQVERMEVMVKEGTAGLFQLTDIKGQAANEEINIVNLENSLQQSKLVLCQLLNIPYLPDLELDRTGIVLSTQDYAYTAAQVVEAAMAQMPLIRSNQLKLKSAGKGIQIAKSGFYPIVSLNGSMGSSYSSLVTRSIPTSITESATGFYLKNGSLRTPVFTEVQNYQFAKVGYGNQMNNNLGFFAGVNIQIPIFNNYQIKNRVKLANINLQAVELESASVSYQLQQQIQQAWLQMLASYKRYQKLEQQLAYYEESYRAAQLRFETGVINAAEFLLAKNNLDRTKLNLVQGKYEYSFRTRLLDFYQGKKIF